MGSCAGVRLDRLAFSASRLKEKLMSSSTYAWVVCPRGRAADRRVFFSELMDEVMSTCENVLCACGRTDYKFYRKSIGRRSL